MFYFENYLRRPTKNFKYPSKFYPAKFLFETGASNIFDVTTFKKKSQLTWVHVNKQKKYIWYINIVNCAAFGCTNRSTSRWDLSFHKIPSVKNKVLRQKWLRNIRRTGNLTKDSSFSICSEYLEEDWFKHDFQVLWRIPSPQILSSTLARIS